ncbi:cytochrome b/b6 domain-containing protein [Pseudoalteromonas sp. S16_S37]|uniref:cytochrome b/b6 domain-containing protein n=1 Tax=Pseudoalteromonas sp. S16_S37 TaxID=2720228 RepID=UPI00314535D5
MLYTLRFKTTLPRMTPQSRRHGIFINTVHGLLYVCIFLLAGTGIAMVTHYELPLNILGIELSAQKEGYFSTFSQFHEIHLLLQQAMWWLIGIHLAGVLYAKR